jgi:hypothetical protein
MADLTIRVPSEHVDAVRDSLLHMYSGLAEQLHRTAGEHAATHDADDPLRGYRTELEDVAAALEQVGWSYVPAVQAVELTAHPETLSDALHGALLDAVEAFVAACRQYWHGRTLPQEAHDTLSALQVRFTLFDRVQQGDGEEEEEEEEA